MITVPMRVAATNTEIPVSVATDTVNLSVGLGAAYSMASADTYEGEYTVTPRLEDQYLETNGKIMRDDVTVYQIPISRVSNPYDGITVLIG